MYIVKIWSHMRMLVELESLAVKPSQSLMHREFPANARHGCRQTVTVPFPVSFFLAGREKACETTRKKMSKYNEARQYLVSACRPADRGVVQTPHDRCDSGSPGYTPETPACLLSQYTNLCQSLDEKILTRIATSS